MVQVFLQLFQLVYSFLTQQDYWESGFVVVEGLVKVDESSAVFAIDGIGNGRKVRKHPPYAKGIYESHRLG